MPEIGRLINHLKEIKQFDKHKLSRSLSAIMVASKEGTEYGTLTRLKWSRNPTKQCKFTVQEIDKIGTEFTSPNYPLGWAQAGQRPLSKYWKTRC
jgi:arylsulfatase